MSSSIDPCTAAFRRLQDIVMKAKVPCRPRTEDEEDLLALEDMLLNLEGPEALARWHERQRIAILQEISNMR